VLGGRGGGEGEEVREGDARAEARPSCISFEWWGWTQPLREGGGPVIANLPPLPVPGAAGPTEEEAVAALRHTEAAEWVRAAEPAVAVHAGVEHPTGRAGPGPAAAPLRTRSKIAVAHARGPRRDLLHVRLARPARTGAREVPVHTAGVLRIGGTPVGTQVGMVVGTSGAARTVVVAAGSQRVRTGHTTCSSTLRHAASRPVLPAGATLSSRSPCCNRP
jgi:hypothetical protein